VSTGANPFSCCPVLPTPGRVGPGLTAFAMRLDLDSLTAQEASRPRLTSGCLLLPSQMHIFSYSALFPTSLTGSRKYCAWPESFSISSPPAGALTIPLP
jgi:hypothetical protein